MRFLRSLVVALALAFTALPAAAEDLTDKQPSYTRIGARCGLDPSRPSFSAADYAKALAEAQKAVKSATREGNRARINAINQSVARMKECMEEETRKFTVPPIRNCREFLNAYNDFSRRAAALIKSGKITTDDRDAVRESFRTPARNCVRDMMTKCIDPTRTSHVDFVIEAMAAAADFGFIYTYAKKSGFQRFLATDGPGNLRMTFCTDTDYACKGNREACDNRIRQIKAIMQTYIED